jgi:hypothetical protein
MNCYSCEQPATNACKRCAKTYCEDHGNATYCADCLRPASALPSFNLYRGALLVMLVGTAVAVFLLVRPPGSTSGSPPVEVAGEGPTATSESGGAPTETRPVTATVAPTAAPEETTANDATPVADETAETEATVDADATESPFREYVVQDGDSLYGIAQLTVPVGDDLDAYARAIASLNGWTLESAELVPGETILLPPLPE